MNPESIHLLVAAEDDALRRTLLDALSSAGFRLEEVCSESEAIDAVRRRPYDLVLLNLGLPGSSGIETCRRLRALSPDLGIVMVRMNGTPDDEVVALDAGADDCIAAPLRFREIIARLSAVLRRTHAEPPPKASSFQAGVLEIDAHRRVLRRSGREVHLSPREFDLLLFFMKNQEEVLTHVKLLRAVWGAESGYDPGYLRTYVKALRRKIEDNPARPEYILTEPWVGYRFHNPDR